ncbi:MAG: winged helix-turn-helix domain-containing protein [Acidobacteriota bacterium]
MSSSVVRFGSFEANFRSGELRKSGIKLKLPGQPLQVLELLLEQPGSVITRDELRRRLWPADTFVDFDNALNTAVNKLREALSDTAANPRFVETLPRRGYRFLAHVEVAGPAAQRAQREAKPMLAVLPFENLGGDPEQEYFADGLTEEMISHLGRLHSARLGVIARTSAMQYKGTHKSIHVIARELGVDFLLEGTVRRGGGKVRITAQLIRAADQVHLWAESYDRTLVDILAIQTEVANHIGRSLAVELLPCEPASALNTVAYDAYLKGRFHWNRRTEEGFKKALVYYQQAIDKDPGYAPPYVGLAEIYGVLGLYGVLGWNRFSPPGEIAGKAKAAAVKALEIDGSLPEAHTALAFARFVHDWDWTGAEEKFRRALQLNPNQALSHCWYALFLAAVARFDEAIAEMRTALALDPLSLVANTHLGWILYLSRQYDEALEQLRSTLEMDPEFAMAHGYLGVLYFQRTRYRKAQQEFGKAFESVGDPAVYAGLCERYAQALKGEPASPSQGNLLSPYLRAIVQLSVNQREQALDSLEQAYAEHSCWLVNLKVEPTLDALRSDPRFEDLLRRVGLAS